MRGIRAKAALAALAFLPALATPVHAGGDAGFATRVGTAVWTGTAEFGDCGTTVCFSGESLACLDAFGALFGGLPSCRARLSGHYTKAKAGPAYVCAGVGAGELDYTDWSGTTYSIPVVLLASDGVIAYSGRWVGAVGQEAVSVEGTVHSACPVRVAAWDGTLTFADA